MKTIRLDVEDNIFDKVMFFLNNLPKSDVRLKIETEKKKQTTNKLRAISLKTKNFKFSREEANDR